MFSQGLFRDKIKTDRRTIIRFTIGLRKAFLLPMQESPFICTLHESNMGEGEKERQRRERSHFLPILVVSDSRGAALNISIS